MLVPNDPTTGWYHSYEPRAAENWLIGTRIKFIGARNLSMTSHMLLIFRPDSKGPPDFKNWRPVPGRLGGEFF